MSSSGNISSVNNSAFDSVHNFSNSYQPGDLSWILTSSAMIWLMGPGVGLFYSGLNKSKNVLSLILLSLVAAAVTSIQWLLFGYSLTFSTTGSFFIGKVDKVLFSFDWAQPSPGSSKLPELLYAMYQALFAMVTPSIIIGAGAGRARFLPTVVFMLIWSTVVYDFVAYWVWNPNGWLNRLGSLDFAGGSPVHITSGAGALALSIFLGRKKDVGNDAPETVQNVIVGAVLIWFGWFGFNGGSALTSGMRSIMAFVVTNMAASAGALTSMILEYRVAKKFSPVAFCTGGIIGLVAITPGCGYVGPMASIAFGIVSVTVCNMLMAMKHHVPVDDATDVFIVHAVAGVVGNLLTGVFAQSEIAALDGSVIQGGWVDGNWMQMLYQFAGSFSSMTWSFVWSLIILWIIDMIPGLKLRAETSSEKEGLDKTDLGMSVFSPSN